MQYRYSRGQPGQGSLPRPAWGSGSGSHGARTASPEPGGLSSGNAGALGSGASADPSKGTPQDEVILQLEHELNELRNMLAWKDQRIADLSRTDIPAARLKRDIRNLASELHRTRKDLSESVREAQELRSQLERGEGGRDGAQRDIVDSPSAATSGNATVGANTGSTGRASAPGDRDRGQLRSRVVELEEENRQLRETVVQLKGHASNDHLHQGHARQPSGASTQRAAEPPSSAVQPPNSTAPTGGSGTASNPGASFAGSQAARQSYINAPSPTVTGSSPVVSAPSVAPTTPMSAQEEPVRQTVYSSQNMEFTSTIGPTTLQGVGTVDGVAMVAKVLLSRIHSSVCSAQRRPQMGAPLAPGQPGPMMVQMPMT